jgi:hypothetical protein
MSQRPGVCGERPRDRHTMAAGEQLDTDPAKRTAVNVGTRSVPPRPRKGAGTAQRQLMAPGGGIALVVVVGVTTDHRGRESRLQGDMLRATYPALSSPLGVNVPPLLAIPVVDMSATVRVGTVDGDAGKRVRRKRPI